MANTTLIKQSDALHESQVDTTDYASLLLDPAAEAMKINLEEEKRKTNELMALLPEGIDLAEVDKKLHPMITEWTIEQNEKYVAAANIASKIDDTTDPRFIKARDDMNQVIRAFENLDEGLNGEKSIGIKMQNTTKSQNNIAGGVADHITADMNLFVNGGILDRIIEQGIGDDGTLSYKSYETVDNTAKIKTLETELAAIEDKTSTEYDDKQAEITELKAAKGTNKIKKVNAYVGHPEHNVAGVNAVNAFQEQVRKHAKGSGKWEGTFKTDMEVSVDALIKTLTPAGVKDIMFIYYIDGYIEANTGFKKGSPEFEAEKTKLKSEDLTDEFRNHVLGTDTVPGMLENTHTENYKQPAGSKITQYPVGNNIWRFRNEENLTEGEGAAREVVLQALGGEKSIFVKGSGWHDLVDGKYKQRGPFEKISDSEGRGTDHDDYEETRKAPPTPLSPRDFIKQFGGGMQPMLVKGIGYSGIGVELEVGKIYLRGGKKYKYLGEGKGFEIVK